MSNDKVLSDKDIDNIWRSVKSVSPDDAMRMIKNRIVKPITTSDGYFALLSLDIHNDERKEYHLSISNPLGIAKFEIAAAMAREILGDCDKLDVRFKGVYHFVKSADESADDDGIHKINKNKEEKLKYGKVVEGDVNNGIEGRTKKEIQTEGIVERCHRNWENIFGS